MDEKKKYNYMENVLQNINKNYISLPENEVKRNNKVLEEVLIQIIQKMKENSDLFKYSYCQLYRGGNVLSQITMKMKEKNDLFKYSYSRVFYGGSYYDGLRVGNPEEFDLDLLMTLPKYADPTLTNSNMPGFVHLQLKEMAKWEKQPEAHRLAGLDKLLDNNNFLVTTKVSAWIEGIVKKALNDFPQNGNSAIFKTSSGIFHATIHKGGPAHTLKLTGTVDGKKVAMDVDLVPCFVFAKDKWPPSPYRPNPVSEKPEFFIVPKRPGGDGNVERYWRLSFQEQERVLINSQRTLKPTIKLMKKLRDNLNHQLVASYFIKTVFLWEVEKNKELWNNSLGYVFMTMLKKYKQFFDQGKIPYFWNKNNNLLGKANPKALENIANKLKNVIDDIEKHPEDPYVIAKYLVSNNSQIEQLKSETVIGKKTLKQLEQLKVSNGSNGTVTLIQKNATSFSTNVDQKFYQTESEILKTVKEIVRNHFKENPTITLTNSFQSDPQMAATEPTTQKNGAIKKILCFDSANCGSSEVDSAPKRNFTEIAVNKLQDSVDKLTMAMAKIQNDNQKMLSIMTNLSEKIDDINANIGDIKKENQMLRSKLKTMDTENREKDDIDGVYFLADRLNLTARHDGTNYN